MRVCLVPVRRWREAAFGVEAEMSAAATAAGYLYASGRLRGAHGKKEQRRREAERAALELKLQREHLRMKEHAR